METEQIVKLDGVYKRFPAGKTEFTALNNINLTFGKGEFAGLVGPSGSGKTTLLNIIGSLDSPSEGTADVLGKRINTLSHKEAALLRNMGIGFIFQTYNLLPVYTVYDNVEFALLLQKRGAADRKKAVMEALEWVGLTDKVNSKPAALSGGECQRVAIARALINNPSIVLADEPTGNLDSKTSYEIMDILSKIHGDGNTVILVTHEEDISQFAHRIIRLKDGLVETDRINANPSTIAQIV